jgi:hypothetical protein
MIRSIRIWIALFFGPVNQFASTSPVLFMSLQLSPVVRIALCLVLALPIVSSASLESFPSYVTIQNAGSGRVIECRVNRIGMVELGLAPHLKTPNQEWMLQGNGVDGYKIVNRKFPYVLDLKHANGWAQISVWEDLGLAPHQSWALHSAGPHQYFIRSISSGRFLDEQVLRRMFTGKLQQWSHNGGLNQLWNIVPIPERFTGMHFIENEYLRLGIDADAGGAVAWLSVKGSDRNVINTKDLGRYLQQSYYAGDGRDRRGEGQADEWAGFPWNPLQAGDFHGKRSQVLDLEVGSGKIYVKTRPVLWDMNGEFADAYMETWIELKGQDVVYHGKLTRFHGVDAWGESEHSQELPAIYLHSDFKHFYSYTGHDAWKYQFNTMPSERMWESWLTHESWVACVDDNLWGFSVHFPGVATFKGGYYHINDDPIDSTAYVSPRLILSIPRGTSFEYRVFFSLGRLNDLMHRVYIRQHNLMLEAAAAGNNG